MDFLLVRLLGLAAAALGFWGLLWGYGRQRRRRQEAEARAAALEAELEHRRKIAGTDKETEHVRLELEKSLKETDGLAGYFRNGRLLRRDTDGGDS